MRIGFFTDTYTPQINGVVTSIQLFKAELEARGHEVFVFAPTPHTEADGDNTVRFRSVPFVFQPEMRIATPLSLEAHGLIDSANLDIVHSHDPFAIGLYGLTVAQRRKIPYVHTYHTLYPEYVHYVWETRLTKKLAERLSREFCDLCDSIIAPSTKVERYLRTWGVKVPIDVIATGVDVARFSVVDQPRIDALRVRHRITPEDRVVLFMGRLGREKNVELLIRAIWHCQCPNALLLVAGDGPQREALEDLAADLGISDRVRFSGYLQRDDVVAAYHLADVFGFASTTETQGLVLAEALAAGLPIVSVEDDALEDFAVSGRNAIVVPSVPEEFAAALDYLLTDDEERAILSASAAEGAPEFSIGHQTTLLERLYERAVRDYTPPKRLLRRLALPRGRKGV